MKKYILLASITCGLMFTGCENFLTLESPGLVETNFWKDSTNVEMGLSACYGQLENRTDLYNLPEIKFPVEAFREDVMVIGADVANYPNWVELANFNYTNGNSQFEKYWQNNYNGINYANQVLKGIDLVQSSGHTMTAKTEEQLRAEAYFLRAYYHMKLILNWKEIFIRDVSATTEAETNKAISTRSEAWNFIIEDFKKATVLPAVRTPETVGRATSAAAYAYLGWAYLTLAYEVPEEKAQYLQKAIDAFDEIKDYSLEKDFIGMFNGTNENSKEAIFEIQFIEDESNGTFHKHCLHKWIAINGVMGGWGEMLPSQMLIDEFKKEGRIATTGTDMYDSRMYQSLYFDDPYWTTGRKIYSFSYSQVFKGDVKSSFRKYLPADRGKLMDWKCAVNVPVMRYANVLLMKAEAYNEQGHPELAIPLINEVRDVHGDMPAMTGTSQADVRKQIEHERLLEFPMENLRWYDLRRWGKLTEAMKAAGRNNFDEERHSFYPIPLMEVQANTKYQ